MGLPERGKKVNLIVAAAFPHHLGQKKGASLKSRGQGKPSLELTLEALPMQMQLELKSVVPKKFDVIDGLSPLVTGVAWLQGVAWRGGTLVQSILDTGASYCVMSTEDALKLFSTTLDWNQLEVHTVTLTNGAEVEGRRVWMRVQIAGVGGPFYMVFIISDQIQSPILISWRVVRKMFRFLLEANHLALCE